MTSRTPVLVLLLGAAVLPAFAGTVDEDLRPGGRVLSTLFPSSEVETFRVEAPAGSTLRVDLRPAVKGGLVPSLEAILPDGGPAPVPAADRAGRVKVKLPFDRDGTAELRVGSASGTGDYLLRTRLKAPRRVDLSGTVPAEGTGEVSFFAPPGSLATLKVKKGPGSALRPAIASLEGPGGPAAPLRSKSSPSTVTWKKVPLDAFGPWTLAVEGADGTTGGFTARIGFRTGRGPDEDHRDGDGGGDLGGTYAAWIATLPEGGLSPGLLLSGTLVLDPSGSVGADLRSLTLAPDAASPLGFSLGETVLEGASGTWTSDGALASLSLDLGAAGALDVDLAVAAGGAVLVPVAPAEGVPAATGVLLRRAEPPTAASLAGPWFYLDATMAEGGAATVEIGSLTLSAAGGASGLGTRTTITVDGEGTPQPGSPIPVLRAGTFTVGPDGTLTVRTVPNLFNPQETWTLAAAFGQDLFTGPPAGSVSPGSEAQVLLRQGTGLSDADATGDYLHLGLEAGTGTVARTGVLAFDGAGGFSGTETVVDLAGGGLPQAGVPASGSYSLNASGFATFAPDGGVPGTGIAGPDARYLLTVGLGTGGIAIDFLVSLAAP